MQIPSLLPLPVASLYPQSSDSSPSSDLATISTPKFPSSASLISSVGVAVHAAMHIYLTNLPNTLPAELGVGPDLLELGNSFHGRMTRQQAVDWLHRYWFLGDGTYVIRASETQQNSVSISVMCVPYFILALRTMTMHAG
ncbi:unnamed protein product [Protopolystoma xenopodis]|uniref:SH2 domain-containing protein n=1 Tax=Protopolystoma xenopodis TaxID=117903 RepID=A0A3S5AYY0_9PLAT|nr:unnamed protein product [Protopolystoma xenopodis]